MEASEQIKQASKENPKTRAATIIFDGGFSLQMEYVAGRRFKSEELKILKCAIKTMLRDLNGGVARNQADA